MVADVLDHYDWHEALARSLALGSGARVGKHTRDYITEPAPAPDTMTIPRGTRAADVWDEAVRATINHLYPTRTDASDYANDRLADLPNPYARKAATDG